MTEHVHDAEGFRRAMAEAAGSAVWLEGENLPGGGRYIHIVASWDLLDGPAHGTIAVPEPLADYAGEIADLDRLDTFGDSAVPTDLLRLYHRVINRGSAQQQQAVLNRDLLVLNWTERIAESPVKELWEQRFPQIRG